MHKSIVYISMFVVVFILGGCGTVEKRQIEDVGYESDLGDIEYDSERPVRQLSPVHDTTNSENDIPIGQNAPLLLFDS